MQLNINTDEVVSFTNKLEKMHRSALPVAIRTALSSAAFDVKTKSMPKSANKAFTNRDKNFFKAKSKVNKANGFDIKTMKASVGFVGGEKSQAIRDLEQQEKGGTIKGRSFIPIDSARVGGSNSKKIRKQNRISDIRGFIDARKSKGAGKKQKFVRAAFAAKKQNKLLLGNHEAKGGRTLSKIKSINKRGGKVNIKRIALYSLKKGRVVNINPTNFMKRASHESGLKVKSFYIKEAKKQIERLRK
jgi:hypothetical protein